MTNPTKHPLLEQLDARWARAAPTTLTTDPDLADSIVGLRREIRRLAELVLELTDGRERERSKRA